MNEFIIGTDVFYNIVLYVFIAYYVGKLIDSYFSQIFPINTQTNFVLLIQVSLQYACTAVIAFLCRKLIKNIPFPLDGFDGYKRVTFSDISDDFGIIWASCIVFFEPTLVEKIKLLRTNLTNFF